MSRRLVTHLGIALCWSSITIGCSDNGPGGVNGGQSTSRPTGGRSNGTATATGGTSQTNGSGGANTSGATGGSSSGGNPYRCADSCILPAQYCDDAGQCVVCLSDAQCHSSEQQFCFLGAGPSYGNCVQCLQSSQCDGGEVCSPEMTCVPGCTQDASCGKSMPFCEGDSGICVSCLSAAQCSGGLVCEKGQCMECTSDYECYLNYPNLWVCSPEANCVQCRIDDDCPQGEHCVGTGCQ